jgi:hypothetical protein
VFCIAFIELSLAFHAQLTSEVMNVADGLSYANIEKYVFHICSRLYLIPLQGSRNGKTMFIGCSNWCHQDEEAGYEQHRTAIIPPTVNEDVLAKIFNNLPIEESQDTAPCHHIAHPQTKRKVTPTCRT